MQLKRKPIALFLVAVGLLIALLLGTSWLIEHPLRTTLVDRSNRSLTGYRIELQGVDVHPLSFSMDLNGLRLIRDDLPSPPLLTIPSLSAGIHWKALLHGRVVAHVHLESPRVAMDATRLGKDLQDETPLEGKGWQDAVSRMSPIEIDDLRISNATVSYSGRDDGQPLVIEQLHFQAANIRNIRDPEAPYPSDVEWSGRILGQGAIVFKGQADFLAPGLPALKGRLELDNMPLAPLGSVAEGSPVSIDDGTLETLRLEMEYSKSSKRIRVTEATFNGLEASYVYPAETGTLLAGLQARADSGLEDIHIQVDRLSLTAGNIGFINRKTDPNYRVFASGTRLTVEHFSNRGGKNPMTVRLRGAFMNSGSMAAFGTFQHQKGNFDLRVAINGTHVTEMNPILKAYSGLDASAGVFSLFSEVSVQDGHIDGYVKPLFRDLEITDRRQDQNDNLFDQIYEGAADALVKLLENSPRDAMVTRADLSGRIDNPDANILETLLNLIRNAFVDAILPGFESGYDS